MVSAKRYLEEIKRTDNMIDILIQQKEEAYAKAFSLGSKEIDGMNIQRSAPDGDRMADAVIKYTMLEEKITDMIDGYIDFKDKVIHQIAAIPAPAYGKLLALRYLQYKGLEKIAAEVGYSYEYIRKLHSYALQMFEDINKKEIEEYFSKK